jgi:FkbM family methyltransferase
VEAGASTGTDTERMAIRWPKGFLYSYEPVPRQFDEAIKRCARFDNVFLSNRALGEKKGKALFYISNTKDLQNPDNGPSSLLYPSGLFSTYHPQFDFKETIETDVITLDDVMEEHHLSHIDLLWLDLQGYEPAVLRASPKALKTVHVIFTEVSLIELYSESELYISFKNWLESEGFQVVREDLPYVDAGNVLFIRRRYK